MPPAKPRVKSREVFRDVIPQEAVDYFKAKKLKPSFSYLDVWREEHNYAFTVAKITERRILGDVQDALETALTEGTTFAQFKRDIKPTLDKSGWSDYGSETDAPRRLKTIYQTNMRVARAAGQWQRIQRTKQALPYLEYQLGPSEHHRPQHVEWDGLVLSADDPFWQTHMPPNGWGCKCHVRQVGRSEASDLGVDKAPDPTYDEWVDPQTGVTEQVPTGIDPGWDYNPGIERGAQLQEELTR